MPYTGNNISVVNSYTLSPCPAKPSFNQVLTKVLSQSSSRVNITNGSAKTLAQLKSTYFFSTSLCKGDPQLLASIQSYCGGSPIEGWYGQVQGPCPGCTLYNALVVISCPAVKRAIAMEAIFGWG